MQDDFFKVRPEVSPLIYVYSLPDVLTHMGYLKIGYTDRKDWQKRINEQTHTVAVKPKIEWIISAMRSDGTVFSDKDIHKVLDKKGFIQLNAGKDRNEWYKCTLDDVKKAVLEVKDGIKTDNLRIKTFSMRPEQTRAVEITKSYFESMRGSQSISHPKFLWNCKMRFGKTFASYQLAKSMGLKKILILTFKPAVESAWEDDLKTHIDFMGWQFVSDKDSKSNKHQFDEDFNKCDKNKPVVVFGSFQNLLGTNENGGIKAKNEFIHTTNWDLVIFDEYHFGAWRENTKKLFEADDEEKDVDFDSDIYKRDEADNAIDESFLPITTDYYLFLSGTPFRALNSGEFIEEQIFNWTYTDEQNAKQKWEGDNNPYLSLPRMVLMTYQLPEGIRSIAQAGEFDEFDLNTFFLAEGKGKNAKFKYENEVQNWLDLIRGQYLPSNIDNLKLANNKRPPMPFSDSRLLGLLLHTLWFLPNVAACDAMENLLNQKQNTFYSDYKINNCAGTKAGIGLDALQPVLESMRNDDKTPLETKTITLTCGKLTTGVTVRPWTGIFMLRNLKSPETYFQSAFRVQSPWTISKPDGSEKILKEDCYVFDFALNRALRQISDYSCRLNTDEDDPEKKVADFINFLPVLAYDGSTMKQISAQDVLDIAFAGTSATLLARRWESALLVNVDNITLQKLLNNKEALDALMRIEGFRSLNKDIENIINKSTHVKDVKNNKDKKLSKEEKAELNAEEKEYKTKRKMIQEKLIKFATRIPVFMYLTDYREKCLKDVITQFESGLFKKVTGLDVKDFELLCSLGVFNAPLMNDAIFKFRRYEDSSLSYTGIEKHANDKEVGGWDTAIRKEAFEQLYFSQQESMEGANQYDYKQVEENGKAEVVTDNSDDSKKYEIEIGTKVNHKKHGEGEIVNIDKKAKYIMVKFANKSDKMRFAYPNCFEDGHLEKE